MIGRPNILLSGLHNHLTMIDEIRLLVPLSPGTPVKLAKNTQLRVSDAIQLLKYELLRLENEMLGKLIFLEKYQKQANIENTKKEEETRAEHRKVEETREGYRMKVEAWIDECRNKEEKEK